MSTAAKPRPLVTATELAELPDDWFQYELDQGELIIMAPAGEEHGRTEVRLLGFLFAAIEERGLGTAYSSDTGFVLQQNPDIVRSPDVAFVRKGRRLNTDKSDYIIGAPDLAVEIQSPSQSPADLERKIQQYLEAGTAVVWYVHPRTQTAKIYLASGEAHNLDAHDFLEAPDVLPNVKIPLARIFAQ